MSAAAAVAAARCRSMLPVFIGRIEAYCENPDCAAREVEFRVKENDGPTTPRLLCPVCQRALHVHAVLTLEEARVADDRDARVSVRAQLYQAREKCVTVPLSLLLDDRLPRGAELVTEEPGA